MLQLIQQAILLIGTAAGAVTDAKTGFIYDWITFPMIALGIVLALIQQQWFNLGAGAVVFGALFLAYKFGKLGGGDVKALTGIALLNPTNEINFFISLIFFAAMGAIVFYSVYYTIKYARIGINFGENKKGIMSAIMFAIIIVVYFGALIQMGYMETKNTVMILIPLAFGLVFVALQEGIKKNFFEAKIALGKLEEDEVIAQGRNNKKIDKLLKGKQLLGEKEIAILKKAGIRSIYVLRKLPPFGPFILFGAVIAVLFPQTLLFLFI
ncbi:MAG: A24 family peptidase [Candidatus Diapherotrites archaeon]|nr:A24 family peptidase [Candidatus Diapherotrites archaeon]